MSLPYEIVTSEREAPRSTTQYSIVKDQSTPGSSPTRRGLFLFSFKLRPDLHPIIGQHDRSSVSRLQIRDNPAGHPLDRIVCDSDPLWAHRPRHAARNV